MINPIQTIIIPKNTIPKYERIFSPSIYAELPQNTDHKKVATTVCRKNLLNDECVIPAQVEMSAARFGCQ